MRSDFDAVSECEPGWLAPTAPEARMGLLSEVPHERLTAGVAPLGRGWRPFKEKGGARRMAAKHRAGRPRCYERGGGRFLPSLKAKKPGSSLAQAIALSPLGIVWRIS